MLVTGFWSAKMARKDVGEGAEGAGAYERTEICDIIVAQY
jgi:hypothetical protein